MDTTKHYIDMCEKAIKIQDIYFDVKDFRPHLPSFVYDRTLQRVCIHIWTPSKMSSALRLDNSHLSVSIEWDNDGNIERPEGDERYKELAIWLPRQDQLQEMVTFNKTPCQLSSDFYHWHTEQPWDYPNTFTSFEQLWLAFVMHEKFSKQWNGVMWEENKQCLLTSTARRIAEKFSGRIAKRCHREGE